MDEVRRILIAYDGSEPAQAAIAAAAGLFPGAEARIVYVYDQPPAARRVAAADGVLSPEMLRSLSALEQEAVATVEDGRLLAADAGLAAEATVVRAFGSPWPEILAAATAFDAGAVVTGTRGRGRFGRALLGSTSSSLLHHGDRPVLIVPGEADTAGPVLIAYDGSDAARTAIVTAGRLFPGRDAVVAHVWDWPLTGARVDRTLLLAPLGAGPMVVDHMKQAAQAAGRRIADEGRALAAEHGLAARAQLVEADDGIWRGIAGAAEETGAAVVVAGSRGRGGVAAALLGSVSRTLAHNAERPTLIVRPG